MARAGDDFRREMEREEDLVGKVATVQVASITACACGCGRPAGVAIVSQAGMLILRSPEELGAMLHAMRSAARSLGWEVAGRG